MLFFQSGGGAPSGGLSEEVQLKPKLRKLNVRRHTTKCATRDLRVSVLYYSRQFHSSSLFNSQSKKNVFVAYCGH